MSSSEIGLGDPAGALTVIATAHVVRDTTGHSTPTELVDE